MRRLSLLLFGLFLTVHWVSGQSGGFLISPAAASFQNQSFSGFWSVGEVIGGSSQVDGVIVSQGFTKSTLLSTVTSISFYDDSNYTVYPNPVEDFIVISSIKNNLDQASLKLIDTKGQQIELTNFDNNPFSKRISTTGLSRGVYILIIDGPHLKNPIKFKIYKTHE